MEITEDREFVDVRDFHLKYSQIVSSTPSLLTKRKSAERANFLLEELQEYATAAGLRISVRLDTATGEVGLNFAPDPRIEPDLAEQADALVDLVYVAKGTAVMNGLPWKALWDDVQGANMRKVPGVTKRGNAMDVTKPPGWVGPRGAAILVENGYNHGHFTFGDGSICEALCVDDPIHQTALVEE
jgi:predicted HAD superfamily Cof-like phosphohydrolase